MKRLVEAPELIAQQDLWLDYPQQNRKRAAELAHAPYEIVWVRGSMEVRRTGNQLYYLKDDRIAYWSDLVDTPRGRVINSWCGARWGQGNEVCSR